jgi:Putative Flp pilus-assembly TadE/G-like
MQLRSNRSINAHARFGSLRCRLAGSALVRRVLARLKCDALRLHRDQSGAVSVLTVVTMIGLMIVLGMVINVGRHVDDKIKMQHAADSAAYSGGVMLARGMNAVAYSNHLLCDIFALTAFMREARDRHAESLVPEVLAAWSTIGPIFERSDFEKFRRLGSAISRAVPQQQELVRSYGELSAAISELVLPVLEYVLRERLIPEFARAIVHTMPQLAQQTTYEVARRNGMHHTKAAREERQRGPQVGVLWRTRNSHDSAGSNAGQGASGGGMPVGVPNEFDPRMRSMPVIDPSPGAAGGNQPVPDPNPDPREGEDYQQLSDGEVYLTFAIEEREMSSRFYLESWTVDRLRFFTRHGKMSQFINLWRVFTCGQLTRLLTVEYPTTNLPHIIRFSEAGYHPYDLQKTGDRQAMNRYLDQNFMFLGVVYRRSLWETSGYFFRNRLASDPLAFAQVQLFTPRARLTRISVQGGDPEREDIGGGGVGVPANVPGDLIPHGPVVTTWDREGWPPSWSLFNQNWTVQIVPAYTDSLLTVLQSSPDLVPLPQPANMITPQFGPLTPRDLRRINTH